MVIQPDGKIVASGMADAMFVLVRVTPLGMLDATFGSGGIVQTQIGSSVNDMAHAIALQQDGKIVVAGYSISMNINSPQVFALVRYNNSAVMSSSSAYISSASIFPNPALDIITMSWNAISVERTISIYSVTGDLLVVQHVAGETKTQIDVSGFSNGAYVIVVEDGASRFTTKLMVAH